MLTLIFTLRAAVIPMMLPLFLPRAGCGRGRLPASWLPVQLRKVFETRRCRRR